MERTSPKKKHSSRAVYTRNEGTSTTESFFFKFSKYENLFSNLIFLLKDLERLSRTEETRNNELYWDE